MVVITLLCLTLTTVDTYNGMLSLLKAIVHVKSMMITLTTGVLPLCTSVLLSIGIRFECPKLILPAMATMVCITSYANMSVLAR
jgi:hypothetical protein